MLEVVEYTVVDTTNLVTLVEEVNAKVREGWVPHGAMVAFTMSQAGMPLVCYYQPMVLTVWVEDDEE